MHVSATTFLIILQVGFGFDMERDERHRFAADVNSLVKELMTEYTRMPLRQALAFFGSRDKMRACVKRINATCNKFIKTRLNESAQQKAARRQDMLDAILEFGVHSQEVVASVVVEFALAGYHTTSQILVWSLYQTCCAPHVVAKIHSEIEEKLGDRPLDVPLTMEDIQGMSYIKDVWKETLRLHPSAASIVRMAAKDVTLRGSGYHVPKGTELYGHIRASQQSSSNWKDGASFKPDRWQSAKEDLDGGQTLAGAYLPFGVGQSNCAGRFLADYESLLLLAEMHRRFTFQLACKPSGVKMHSLIVDMPKVMNKETGVESGLQLLVATRISQ